MSNKKEVVVKAGKVRIWTLLFKYFPHALWAVAQVSEVGAKKYGEGGPTTWKDYPSASYEDAQARHILMEAMGEVLSDDGDGVTHAAQDAWNSLAKLEKLLTEPPAA